MKRIERLIARWLVRRGWEVYDVTRWGEMTLAKHRVVLHGPVRAEHLVDTRPVAR